MRFHHRIELLALTVTFAVLATYIANFSYAQTPVSATPITDFVKSANKADTMHVIVNYESPRTVILELQDAVKPLVCDQLSAFGFKALD